MRTKEDQTRRMKRLGLLVLCLVTAAVVIVLLLATRAGHWADQKQQAMLLALVSADSPVEENDKQEFALLDNGQMVDVRCADELERMLLDCEAAGGEPLVVRSYVTHETQAELYEAAVRELRDQGLEEEAARREAALLTPPAGQSEHELGLAVDIAELSHPEPDPEQPDSVTAQWLRENCWRYGFILRYPEGKTGLTGRGYVPWHYRYVGYEAAQQIHELDLCLEEYLEMFYS